MYTIKGLAEMMLKNNDFDSVNYDRIIFNAMQHAMKVEFSDIEEYFSTDIDHLASETLLAAFPFDSTPEGNAYWQHMHDRLMQMERNLFPF